MCGILAALNFDNNKDKAVNADILNMFQDQRKRGTEGFGIVMIQANGDYQIRRATGEIKATIDLYMEEAPMMIMHHRQPTSTDNLINQTHPIVVDNKLLKYKYLVIHNGMISNDDEIIKEHEALGFIYTTKYTDAGLEKFNDSESLAIEVARYIEKQTTEIGTLGSAAFIAIQIVKETNKVDKIYYGRNATNKLKLGASRGKIRISSEGQGEEIKDMALYNFNLGDFKIHKEDLKFGVWKSKTNYDSVYHRGADEWEDWTPRTSGFPKDTAPKNLPCPVKQGSAFDSKIDPIVQDNEPEIEDSEECEMAIDKETEDFLEGATGCLEQFVEDIKDERQVFIADPKEYMTTILTEMYKVRSRVEAITTAKMLKEAEEREEMNKDMPPIEGQVQD